MSVSAKKIKKIKSNIDKCTDGYDDKRYYNFDKCDKEKNYKKMEKCYDDVEKISKKIEDDVQKCLEKCGKNNKLKSGLYVIDGNRVEYFKNKKISMTTIGDAQIITLKK